MLDDVIGLLSQIQKGNLPNDDNQKNLVLSIRGLEMIFDDYRRSLN